MTTFARVFQGRETRQVEGVSGKSPEPLKWFYEPADYEGDTLYSKAFDTQDEAIDAAHAEGFGPVLI